MGDSTGRSKRSKKSPRPKRSDRKQALQPHYQYPVTPASTPMSENMTQRSALNLYMIEKYHRNIPTPCFVSVDNQNSSSIIYKCNFVPSLGMPVATGDSGDGSGVTSPTPTDELETQEKDIETIAPKEKLPEGAERYFFTYQYALGKFITFYFAITETLPTEGDLLDQNQANTDDAKDIVMVRCFL